MINVGLLLVLSLLLREVFKSPLQKPTFSYSNSPRNQLGKEPLRGFATFISLFFKILFILTQVWLFTCYPAQTHSASPQIASGISCCVTSKAVSHDVESMSKAGRALRTGDQEPYDFCYLSPNKSSIPWSLPIWKASTFWPVYQDDIQVFTIQQCIFQLDIKGFGAAFLKKQTLIKWSYILKVTYLFE